MSNSESDFDLRSLQKMEPPRCMCERCRALFTSSVSFGFRGIRPSSTLRCPVCKVEYCPTDEVPREKSLEYLRGAALSFQFTNLIDHCRKLARFAEVLEVGRTVPKSPGFYSPLPVLFEALSNAQQFVHFVSWGISTFMLGALKMAATKVRVRGIVANPTNEYVSDEMTKFQDEFPLLEMLVFDKLEGRLGIKQVPHTKLLVIDGLIAFDGSPNLHETAWRKAGENLENLRVVTKLKEVMELHNRLFSPVWASRDPRKEINMDFGVPFWTLRSLPLFRDRTILVVAPVDTPAPVR